MKMIVLVSCVSKKQNIPLPAKNLYISDWFQKASTYAQRIGDHWFILSAKYGLLPPDKVIEPYNVTLKSMSKYQRQVWAKRVMQDLMPHISPNDTIVFLAGQVYREFMEESLHRIGLHISVPMEGLRIGEQMQWLNHQLRGIG